MKNIFGVIVFLCVGLMAVALLGCSSGGSGTPTTVTTSTSTTTRTATTTSTTSTTLTGTIVYGVIQNYAGISSQIYLYALPNFEGDPVSMEIISTSVSPLSYRMDLPSPGKYFVVASDFPIDATPSPAVGSYAGIYNWTGTDSIEAAGDPSALMNALIAHATSFEVDNPVAANISMHRLIQAPQFMTGTVTWEWADLPVQLRWGIPIVFITDDPTFHSGPLSVSVGQLIPTGEAATYSYSFGSMNNGTYYLIAMVFCGTTEFGGGPPTIAGEYSDGLITSPQPVTFEGTQLPPMNWHIVIPTP